MASSYPTGIDSELQANDLFETLVGAANAALPEVDLFDDQHSVPWTENSAVLKPVEQISVDELITTFQSINASVAEELKKEFDAGRITGAKYAEVYLALTQGALQSAVQFQLGKDQAFWMATKTQADAIAANNQNEVVRLQAMMARATWALTKLQLAKVDSEFGASEYQREEILPAQKALLLEQREAQRAQTTNTRSDGTEIFATDVDGNVTAANGLLGKQMALYNQQKQSYIDDTKIKATKIFSDLWITQKTLDEGTQPANAFTTDTTGGATNPVNFNKIFLEMRKIAGAPDWI